MNKKCDHCKFNPGFEQIKVNKIDFFLCGPCFVEFTSNPEMMGRKLLAEVFQKSGKLPQNNENAEGFEEEPDILTDLTQETFPPVLFRDEVLDRMIQVLLRKTKNNPIIIGEPGTGKTAIVEHFAMMVKNGEIPRLKGYKVYSLQPGDITAGTKFRGDLEKKVKGIIQRVSGEKCVLFIDEFHLLTGGSGGENEVNIANLLKPHLDRGKLKMIGATTLNEYRKIEKDQAFARRMQAVRVNELTAAQTLSILENIKPVYETFHSVKMSNDALKHIVTLADKYQKEKFFPDKAIDILDEAMSRASLDNNISFSKEEKDRMKISTKTYFTSEGLTEQEINDITFKMDEIEISKVKSITKDEINKVVELMTSIPLSSLEKEDKEKLRNFSSLLQTKVIGQTEAIEALARTVKRSQMKLTRKTKPDVLFFAGPTGVGKTEAAKILTESLFGSQKSLLTFDMSDYMEKHNISRLVGSPPGYVGHENEGQLTEAVRRNPFSVILLDEIEKAHPEVFKTFLQVFDEGRLTDSKGRIVDFSNTIIIATSNIGTGIASKKPIGYGTAVTPAVDNNITLEALKKKYPPEFINRLDEIITFKALSEEDLVKIVDLQIAKLTDSLVEQNININLSEEAKKLLAKKGYQPEYGARPLKRIITREVEDLLIDHLLEPDASKNVTIEVNDEKFFIS